MSKRFGLLSVAAVFVSAVFTMASPGPASAADPAVEHCEQSVTLGLYENQGACMNALKTSRKNYCQRLKDFGAFGKNLWWANFENMGECVAYYKKIGH
jgi:hypothetical protein